RQVYQLHGLRLVLWQSRLQRQSHFRSFGSDRQQHGAHQYRRGLHHGHHGQHRHRRHASSHFRQQLHHDPDAELPLADGHESLGFPIGRSSRQPYYPQLRRRHSSHEF